MQLAGPGRLASAGVTAREAEILMAVGRGLTNREIAARMFISVRTVESHVSALLRKLGLSGRPALIQLARQLPGEVLLPVPATSFLGRDEELAEVGGMLAASTFVSLVGPAGCGKTRLALEAARHWHGEARMVDLSAAAAGDVSALVAGGLGLGYETRDLAAAVRMAFSGSDLLVVVDNCEHVAGAAGEVLGGLAGPGRGLRVLATSREPLGADGEHVLLVEPLRVPIGPHPRDVEASAAGRLFVDRAVAASPRFLLDEASAPYVALICSRLDGLPLAIELAAARVRDLDMMELSESLQYQFGVLERAARAGRHRSLSSAIEWSWRLLDDEQRSLLRRLAVLPGEFTLALAAAIGTDPAGRDARSALMRLVEQSLVSVRLPEGEPARYRLLGVIRAFVLEHAAPAADDQVRRAHALFFCDVAERAVRARYHPTPATAPSAGFDEPNLLAALAWSATHDFALADRLLVSVSQLAETDPSRQALELIRDIATRCPPNWSSEALAQAGLVVSYLSLDDAEQLARKSCRAAVSDRDKALANWISGWIHAYRREESSAVHRLGLAISYATDAADPWLAGSALQARGVTRAAAHEAFADLEQAVTQFVVAGDLTHASNARFMLASRAVAGQTRLRDVPVWLDACESYASRHGYEHELAHIRLTRASYQRIRGHSGPARDLLDAALPVFRQAGDFRCLARTLFELAQPPITDDPAATIDLLLQALPAAALAGGPAMHARILAALIAAAAATDDLVLAARCLGVLDALDAPGKAATRETPDPAPPPPSPALKQTLQGPAYATFVSEGRAGGIELITTLYQP